MRSVKSGRLGTKVAAAAIAAAMVPVVATGTAQAQGGSIQYSKATAQNKVVETQLPDGRLIVSVWSDKMAIEVPNIVQRPRDGNAGAPVLYLVNGAGGGEDSATWQAQSDVKAFMADKDVWTVTPIGGAFSYYTDWQRHDPNVQTRYARETDRPMAFETYLAQELPNLFEGRYGGNYQNRKRSLAAISMTATSVLTIAQNHPGRFQAIGSYSGCAETSTPIGYQFINIVTGMRGGANLDNMWGPYPGPGWVANDPVAQAHKFVAQRDNGTLPAMFISTGNGLPGPHESLENWRLRNSIPALANQAIVGGIIEAATQYCTANLARRFGELQIPAQFDFAPNGTHSWGYWEDDLKQSWPMMAQAMNARYGPI
ncbi:alpha/beta hydrolase [Dietzia psychralcaliphila]|uniref:Mycolyltransferase n=1 Tax=Dietzia psychralcaliphila TaxID=139021 RepID=A0AAD0NQV5_9ACTN|nr:alpha/beta hydrolase family protein [Dietzia psychralcaliphila]AWH96509.1 mycolyltransferase [Dietzia psychralcaliphila]PTM90333.1 S-formylglutathione hydrolase FrmB [Dietzia psychralcaliphila]